MRRGKTPTVAREEVRNWPSGDFFFFNDERQLSARAAKLLKAGGTWRSYAYDDCCTNQHTESNQLLIAKNGRFALQPVDGDDFFIAECKKLELVQHAGPYDDHGADDALTCCEPGMMFMDTEMSVGYEFWPRVVKPGVVFEVHDHGDRRKESREEQNLKRLRDAQENVQLMTQAGDIELFFKYDGYSTYLLMRKETATSHRATLQEIAAIKQQRAQERVAEVVAKEQAPARKRRPERLNVGGPKKKRRRKPDQW